ncbi:MAG: HigA family addiction module antidote protein [Gemmatimonadetes bacterium]|nr:HigA family addiction module antidote protein [Gemmatimonadota bacterium]
MAWVRKIRPTPAGEILLEDFLKPLGMKQAELADLIGVSRVRVNELVKGKRGVTPDTALRLGKLFNIEPEFWLNIQQAQDLWETGRDMKVKRALEKITTVAVAT